MNKIYSIKILSTFLLFIGLISACKKNADIPVEPLVNPNNSSRADLSKDSIFLYSKELYLWNTSLPTVEAFNSRSYSSNETELYAITQFSLDPSTGKPYEYVANYSDPKFSFIEYLNGAGKLAALKSSTDETANDFGFSVLYNATSDLRVKYVYPNSPASWQGLSRGCRITSINGQTNLAYSSNNVNFLNDAIFGSKSSINLTFTDAVGASKSMVINRATYTINPILYNQVYTVGTKKVGYIVYNSYTNNSTSALKTVMSNFESQGVTELIMDLRYNGGGFISTADDLINILAPSAQTGSTMYTSYYNSFLQNITTSQRKASVMAKQPLLDDDGKLQDFTSGVNGKFATVADLDFSPTAAVNIEKFAKSGTLNLSRVYFLVTGATASASELTINTLKPVMDVKLIGSTTYGKPVGFFPIRIDNFDLYIPEFETRNKNGEGGYYSGLTVDKVANEDLTKNWGDETETLLSYALLYAKTGGFITTAAKSASLSASSTTMATKLSDVELKTLSHKLDQNNFNGMVKKPRQKF